MKVKNRFVVLLFWMFILLETSSIGFAQLQTTPSNNANFLVNQLIGPGITVSNATINSQLAAAGTFQSNGSNIGLPAGVLLTSGEVANAIGPNLSTGISTSHSSPGDPQLNALSAPFLTEDACILEFDIVAICDTIQISYVFGSDEYDEFVCSDFTDVFGFFISGPGIVGTQNIAVIPGSATPISINTVNIGAPGAFSTFPLPGNCNTTNAAYFTTNNTGTTVEYDGFTIPLIAKSAVIPCSTYHIKLAIADAGDDALDSGVFLEQGGIRCTSTMLSVSSSINNPGYMNAVEGCVNGRFTFSRSGDTTQAQTVNYTVGGTATPLFDYPPLPGSITFPAMVSTVTINVSATADGLPEGNESVFVILSDSVCGTVFSDTATLWISDQIAVDAGPSQVICQGNSVQIGLPPVNGMTYSWLPSTSLSNGTISNPIFQNPNVGTYVYTLIGTDTAGCQGGDTTSVTVQLSPTASFDVDSLYCQGDTALITYTGNAPPNATYNWFFQGGNVISGSGQGPYLVRFGSQGARAITLTVSVGGCTSLPAIDSIWVDWRPIPNLQAINPGCFGDFSGSVLVAIGNAYAPFVYQWSNGSSSNGLLNVGAGTYSLLLTDAHGCTASDVITLVDPPALTYQFAVDSIICNGGTGTATITAAGGTPPYSYIWSNGATTSSISPTVGTYSVTVTDNKGCTLTETAVLDEPPMISLSIAGDSIACDYEQVTLSAIPGGGVPPYAFQWSSAPILVTDTTATITLTADIDRTFTLTMTDSLGCPGLATFFLDANPRPFVEFHPNITGACDSATVTFINTSTPANSSFFWEFYDGTTSIAPNAVHWFSNGVWGAKLTVTSPEGCINSLNLPALVNIVPTPEASFVSDPQITLVDYLLLSEATITFNNTSPWYATAVNWAFGNGDSAFVGQVTYTYPAAGLYDITMTAYNIYGCHDDTTQTLLILNDPGLWIPTAFTPNGDGLNDRFTIIGMEVKTFAIDIFDRWGRLIFRSDDIENSWDGKIGNDYVQEGVYVYKVNSVVNTGPIQRQGSVTVLR
jgi:gliding motility-associated-like protein